MNAMNTPIDIYCERHSAAFWAEPVNALTNASFIIAAMALLALMRRSGAGHSLAARFLVANVALIGVGSFLFHTFANRLTLWADVLPIFIYQLAFLVFYARDVAGLGLRARGVAVIAFVLCNVGFGALPQAWLNGSLAYGGALLFIAAMAVHHRARARREPWLLWWAVGVFVVSLGFRSMDMVVCEGLALGTHFMWHLLNGVVLYLTTRAYLLNARGAG